jgi:Kdo2-lipid IVA lauroyltransferase/acyltransferase
MSEAGDPRPVVPGTVGWRHRVEDAAVAATAGVVRALPMPAVRGLGRMVGRVAYAADRPHRAAALENLAHAFPVRTDAERRAIARNAFAHFGSLLLELLAFDALPPARMLARIEEEGRQHVRDAYDRGRGVLFFTGHFGYWEMQALVHPLVERPVSVLARRLDNPRLHDRLERLRTRTGNAVVYRQGALRRVLRDLAAGRGVALLIDQHLITADAVQVSFFGRPAATTSALASIAARTQAPVVPVFALPRPGGRYRFVYEPPLDPPADASPETIVAFTQRCTGVLESYVRRYPDLWLWMHRRWRR